MTTKRIVFEHGGKCRVVTPATEWFAQAVAESGSEQAALEAAVARNKAAGAMPPGATPRFIDVTDLPPTRVFRDAWRWFETGQPVRIDMAAARVIHRERIAIAEQKARQEVDRAALDAEDDGDTQQAAQLRARRRQLRGIAARQNLDVYDTPDDLAMHWPIELADHRPLQIRVEPCPKCGKPLSQAVDGLPWCYECHGYFKRTA